MSISTQPPKPYVGSPAPYCSVELHHGTHTLLPISVGEIQQASIINARTPIMEREN
jgi:hypothetical protein